jgi:hypothetical protein
MVHFIEVSGCHSKLSGGLYYLSGYFPSETAASKAKITTKPLRLLFLPLTNSLPPHLRVRFSFENIPTNFTSE